MHRRVRGERRGELLVMDQLSEKVIGAAIKVHRELGLVCSNLHMKFAWLTSCGIQVLWLKLKSHSLSCIEGLNSIVDTGWTLLSKEK